MKAIANSPSELAEIFEDLMLHESLENSCAFLHACWLWPDNGIPQEESFERLVYILGDNHEVYSKREREFINQVTEDVAFCSFQMLSRNNPIECRTVAAHINQSGEPLLDALTFMKIINKALSGFNVFLLRTDDGIYLGCSCIRSSSIGVDCVITPLIKANINWEMLYDALLCRNDSKDFYEYYAGIIDVLLYVQDCYCFDDDEPITMYSFDHENDDDPYEDNRHLNLEHNIAYSSQTLKESDRFFDKEAFSREVLCCMEELAFIVTNHINPLELLFEAQKAFEQSQEEERRIDEHQGKTVIDEDTSKFELLNDPISLMKILKKERGL